MRLLLDYVGGSAASASVGTPNRSRVLGVFGTSSVVSTRIAPHTCEAVCRLRE